MLRESFHMLRRDAACGVDKVSVADFEKDLEANLADLLDRLKAKRYRAKLLRRKYIPKSGGKLRPLGIPAVVKFSRFDVEGSGKFTFLGFDFYWARTRKGGRTVKRRTNAKKMNESLRKMKKWIRDNRSSTLKKLCESLKRKLHGHNNYYGVIGNGKSVSKYHYHCQQIVFKWLNRRSQRQSYNWPGFNEMWKSCALPPPRIVEGPYEPQSRLDLSYVYA
jgi:hypothetical protein